MRKTRTFAYIGLNILSGELETYESLYINIMLSTTIFDKESNNINFTNKFNQHS